MMNVHIPYVDYDLLALINLVICGFICGICICRIGRLSKTVLLRVKIQYIALLVIASASGASPVFFQTWPQLLLVVTNGVVLYIVWSDGFQWRHGVPPSVETRPADLEEHHAE